MGQIIDRSHMARALSIAQRGWPRVFPNPLVGCVIAHGATVIAEGFHAVYGGEHAEIAALRAAGRSARGATMYVTLEPCAYQGKTPPCAPAILRAGIARVAVAIRDPNPLVRGAGVAFLRRAGIPVNVGLLAAEARRANAIYLKGASRTLPVVTVKVACTLDGRIAAVTGDSRWISSPASRDRSHALRAEHDAIIVGVGTVTRDDPALTSHGMGRDPIRVVVDPDLRSPRNSRVFDGTVPTILVHDAPRSRRLNAFLTRPGIIGLRVTRAACGKMDFRDILTGLHRFSLRAVLIEGGGETIAAAVESGCVDELVVFMAPKIIGGTRAPGMVGGSGRARMRDAIKTGELKVTRSGPDLMIRASLRKG